MATQVEGALDPFPGRRRCDVGGESGEAGRRFDLRAFRQCTRLLFGGAAIEPGRGARGTGQPIDHDVVEQRIHREALQRIAAAVAPRLELLDDPGREADRRVAERHAQGLRSRRVDALVGGLVVERGAHLRQPGLLVGAERRGLEIEARPQPHHVEMDAEHARVVLLRMIEGQPRRDDGAPVATLDAIGPVVVELLGDELVPEAGDGARPDRARGAVGADRRTGEAIAGQRGHDHVEGVEWIAAMIFGVGEDVDEVQELDDRSRPAVGYDQRQGARRILDHRAGLADEVEPLRTDIDQVIGPPVDLFLAALPVVAMAPVVDQFGQEGGIGARGPGAPVLDRRWRAPATQALVEIDQRPFGNVDLEGLGSLIARVGHADRRSAELTLPANRSSAGRAQRHRGPAPSRRRLPACRSRRARRRRRLRDRACAPR